MLFSNTILQPKQDSRRSLLEHDLYDDRESCVRPNHFINTRYYRSVQLLTSRALDLNPYHRRVGKTTISLNINSSQDVSAVFGEFHQKWKLLSEDPLALTEEYCKLTEECLEYLPKPGRRATLSKK